MNDLATLTGQPKPLFIDGKRYWLYPQTLYTLGRFQAWLDMQTTDPEDAVCAAIGDFPAQAQHYLLDRGVRRAQRRRPLIGSRAAEELAYSVGGISELLYLSLRRGRRASRREAQQLYWKLDVHGRRAVMWTIWGDAKQDDEDDPLSGDDSGPRPEIDWVQILRLFVKDPFSMSVRDVLRMTWPQILCVGGEGKGKRGISSAVEYMAHMEGPKEPWD